MSDATGSIWCMLSIENNYDQPENNLICWWSSSPTINQISQALGLDFKSLANDSDMISILKLYQGQRVLISSTEFRVQKVEEGVSL